MTKIVTKTFLAVAFAAIAFTPAIHADEWNQKTIFTFSGPVEIPGRTLEAGTYVFKLLDSQSNRNIVQVFSEDQKQLYATFLAIPDYRLTPAGKTIISFEERPGEAPDAIKGWFYPGKNHGHEFVYPKNRAIQLAETRHTPVPAMPAELAPEIVKPAISLDSPEIAELESAPLKAEEPNGAEVELALVFPQYPSPTQELPARLPDTAGTLPLLAIGGTTSLAIAFVLGRLRKARQSS